MSKKTVIVFAVEGVEDFADILLDERFHNPIQITPEKSTELKFVSRNNRSGLITGLFITTLRKGIPPVHVPGENDYSAIQLNDNQGLAYPNTILFDPDSNALYIESNLWGLSEKRMAEYFNSHAVALKMTDFKIKIAPVLKSDAYERTNNLTLIDSIEYQIANPLGIISREMKEASMSEAALLAESMNASKIISVKIEGEEIYGGIPKDKALKVVEFFDRIIRTVGFNRRNKLEIKGRKELGYMEDALVKEGINYFLDKIKDSFELEEPPIASNPQYYERLKGIKDVYDKHYKEVNHILIHI